MKIIVAGCRDFSDKEFIFRKLKIFHSVFSELVSGGARGVDSIGEEWAIENSIPLKIFPANWGLHKKAAGIIRNKEMALYADGLIAFKREDCKGTKNMIEVATQSGLVVHVVNLPSPHG